MVGQTAGPLVEEWTEAAPSPPGAREEQVVPAAAVVAEAAAVEPLGVAAAEAAVDLAVLETPVVGSDPESAIRSTIPSDRFGDLGS